MYSLSEQSVRITSTVCSDNEYVLVIRTNWPYSLSELKANIGTNCSDNEYRQPYSLSEQSSDNEYERIYLSEQTLCSDNESYSL